MHFQHQVNVIHVNATAKNAADDKLRQSIRRYAQNHHAPATVILITGNICNFSVVSMCYFSKIGCLKCFLHGSIHIIANISQIP